MKVTKHIFSIFILLSFFCIFSSCGIPGSGGGDSNNNNGTQTAPATPAETPNSGETDENDTSESNQEKAVLDEMNYARTKPTEYVTVRLEPLKSSYSGTKLSALNELISEMNSMTALPAYSWGEGLAKAAKDWVNEQGPKGETGHGDPWSRIKKYCTYSTAAENISYGYSDAKDIVIQLLVDDGVDGRGHRKNIFSKSCTHAGAAIGTHKGYRNMCVIDFAGGYREK